MKDIIRCHWQPCPFPVYYNPAKVDLESIDDWVQALQFIGGNASIQQANSSF